MQAVPAIYVRQIRTKQGMVDVLVDEQDRDLVEFFKIRIVEGRPRVFRADGKSRSLLLLMTDRVLENWRTTRKMSPLNGNFCDMRRDNLEVRLVKNLKRRRNVERDYYTQEWMGVAKDFTRVLLPITERWEGDGRTATP